MLSSLEDNLVNERKFFGCQLALGQARTILETYCAEDDWHAEDVVNSVYFDTPGFASYRETVNGDNIKTKVRLRWYGPWESLPEEVPVFIEVKGRFGAARRKSHEGATAPRALLEEPLEGWGLADFLFGLSAGLGLPLSRELRPVCLISYNRRRYFDIPSKSRVALDWDIRAERFNSVLLPCATPVRLGALVCEFKNVGGNPPQWAALMMEAGLRIGRFSKYGECMSRLISGESNP